MGGKTWSKEEESYFWRVIIPQSPKAAKESDRVHTWAECAEMMQHAMGEDARRKYTTLMLFEHYFQNFRTGHKSPRAREFVAEHSRHVEREMSAAPTHHSTLLEPVKITRRKKQLQRAVRSAPLSAQTSK